MNNAAEIALYNEWERDLSTCVEAELRERWQGDVRKAIDRLDKLGFEGRLKDHNPIYYIAENLYFNNVRGKKGWLYPPFHRDIICKEFLDYYFEPQGLHRGLLLLAQRDSFKSTFSQGVLPTFCFLRGAHIDQTHPRSGLIHFKEMQASRNLIRVKRKTFGHHWFKRVWPEFSKESDYGTKTEFTWGDDTESYAAEQSVVAMGITGDATGFHFQHIFFSDLVTKEHIKSRVIREDTRLRHDALIYTLDVLGGKRWYDGTRYHVNDMWGGMIKANEAAIRKGQPPLYRIIKLGAADDSTGFANLTLPERHTRKYLEEMQREEMEKTGSDILFQLQMFNEPRAANLIATDEAWLRYCPMSEVPKHAWRLIIVDPAWKGSKNSGEGDFAAIEVWAIERRNNVNLRYLLHVEKSNEMTSYDGIKMIFALMRKYGVRDVAVEEIGGYAFTTDLEQQAASFGLPINLIELASRFTGKSDRIVTFLRAVQAKQVFIVNEAPGQREFVNEFCDFPQLDHDDVLDCAAYTSDPNVLLAFAPRGADDSEEEWGDIGGRETTEYLSKYCLT